MGRRPKIQAAPQTVNYYQPGPVRTTQTTTQPVTPTPATPTPAPVAAPTSPILGQGVGSVQMGTGLEPLQTSTLEDELTKQARGGAPGGMTVGL